MIDELKDIFTNGFTTFTLFESEKSFEHIENWLKKHNIEHSIKESNEFGNFEFQNKKLKLFIVEKEKAKNKKLKLFIVEKEKAKLFQETWVFEYSVMVQEFYDPYPNKLAYKLNHGFMTSRGTKFPERKEIVEWLQNNGIKFKFEYIGARNRIVTEINFTKEENKALFLLAWVE